MKIFLSTLLLLVSFGLSAQVGNETLGTGAGNSLTTGDYKVEVYYTCPEDDVGSTFELAFGASRLKGEVTEAFDNPMRGAAEDRAVRKGES